MRLSRVSMLSDGRQKAVAGSAIRPTVEGVRYLLHSQQLSLLSIQNTAIRSDKVN
jgi:hypothetical protein